MDKSKEEIILAIKKIMSNNIVGTLSTCDQNICHSNNIYYAVDDNMNLVFVSDKDTQHAQNISKNSNVSIVVNNEPQSYGQGHQGIQISGKCVQASGLSLINGWLLYTKRFPVFTNVVKNVSLIEKSMVSIRLYTVKVERIKIIDVPSLGKGSHIIDF